MSVSLNNITISGNLTRDPETKDVGSSTVCNIGIANNRRWKGSDGEQKEETNFFEVRAWGKTADLCSRYLSKGRGIIVEGRLQLDSWETNGEKRSKVVIVADRVHFMPGKGEDAPQEPRQSASVSNTVADLGPDDEPPF